MKTMDSTFDRCAVDLSRIILGSEREETRSDSTRRHVQLNGQAASTLIGFEIQQ